MRRQIAAVAVVALLLFAGCNGGTTPSPDDSMTTTPNGGAAQADPLYETPFNASTVADAHVEALRDAGTYTMRSNATQSARNTTTETSTVVRGDLSTGAVFTRSESQMQAIEGFVFANGTAYSRYETGSGAQYVKGSQRMGNATQYARSSVGTFVSLFNFTYTGTQSANGSTVYVYEASGVDELNTSAPAFDGRLNESMVKSVNATLHVREDGVVTLASYDITVTARGQEVSLAATQRYTKLGETDVSPPAWIDEARANTTSQ